MRRTHKFAAATCAALAVATISAGLASAGPMGPGFGPMGGSPGAFGPGAHFAGGNPTAFVDTRLGELKTTLKITAAQEPAWDAFAGKVRQQAEAMQSLRAKFGEASGPAPDRMAQRVEFMKQSVAGMESTTAAMKALYAVLTPEQKATADQIFGAGPGRGRHMPFGPRGW
jgi:Spy/CpxP family protein refolding chaperone